jgi:hypothetical protein
MPRYILLPLKILLHSLHSSSEPFAMRAVAWKVTNVATVAANDEQRGRNVLCDPAHRLRHVSLSSLPA